MKKIQSKLLALLMACAVAVSLAGFGTSITGVSLNLPETLERGSVIAATPEYAFDKATPEIAVVQKLVDKQEFSYTSSDPDVVTIDENGNLTAVGIGTAEVAMSSKDGKLATARTIEVVVTPTEISMADAITLSMNNDLATVMPAVKPDDATHVQIAMTSSDEKVVTVDAEKFEIHAVGAGEAVVTASVVGTELKAECKIKVLPAVETVELSEASLSLAPKKTTALAYTFAPENADVGEVAWASSDEAVATVDAEGNVVAVADGKATITVTVGGVEAACEVTVATPKKNSGNGGSGGAGGASGGSGASGGVNIPANNTGFQTGRLPLEHSKGSSTWWGIDATDDAYWACANNINQMRRDAGLPELQVDAGLSAIATQRCLDMVTTGTFSHDGCKTSGEIIARSQYTAAQACEAWRTSPSHYEAITYPDFKRMGVGCVFLEVAGQPDVYGTLWTVVFEY